MRCYSILLIRSFYLFVSPCTCASIYFALTKSELPSVEEGSVGEVSVQVDLFTHPGSGEHKVTAKGKISSFNYLRLLNNTGA